jgi:hypothetical protein
MLIVPEEELPHDTVTELEFGEPLMLPPTTDQA